MPIELFQTPGIDSQVFDSGQITYFRKGNWVKAMNLKERVSILSKSLFLVFLAGYFPATTESYRDYVVTSIEHTTCGCILK